MNIYSQLTTTFPKLSFKQKHLLAPYTTIKIGGPAEVFCEAKDNSSFIKLTKFCKKNNIKLTILGLGSNTLIADEGIRGLVVKNSSNNITITQTTKNNQRANTNLKPRLSSNNTKGSFKYKFNDLDYKETGERVLVKLDAGVVLSKANTYLLKQGITGLQWYARIPSTLGGAVYNNIHGGTHFISEVVKEVEIVSVLGELETLSLEDLELNYDYSRFHHTKEIITSVTLNLFYGNTNKAEAVTKEWTQRKSIQPFNSLGCVFQNITNEQKEKLNLPTTSIGYIIEHILDMKGFSIGDAQVSTKHSAFIINKGNATAKDFLELLQLIIKKTEEKLNITLKPEVSMLGFEKNSCAIE